MIPNGAPSFIILVLCAGMMGIIIALMNFLYGMHLLGRSLFSFSSSFTLFHYNLMVLIGYLATQFLGIVKIVSSVNWDFYIMLILFIENVSIISFIIWIYQYRIELLPVPSKE